MLNWKAVVGVAQLVERRSVAPNVAGSNPVSHPNSLSSHASRISSGDVKVVGNLHVIPEDFQLASGFFNRAGVFGFRPTLPFFLHKVLQARTVAREGGSAALCS